MRVYGAIGCRDCPHEAGAGIKEYIVAAFVVLYQNKTDDAVATVDVFDGSRDVIATTLKRAAGGNDASRVCSVIRGRVAPSVAHRPHKIVTSNVGVMGAVSCVHVEVQEDGTVASSMVAHNGGVGIIDGSVVGVNGSGGQA